MISDPLLNRGQQDVSLLATTPTAPKKSFDMDTTQKGTSEYKNKLMAQWTYEDIVQFFMDGPWGFQSKGTKDIVFNFSAISGATGPEMMRFPRSRFLKFSPKYGDEIYDYMQRKVANERERERAEAPHLYTSIIHSPSSSSYTISSPSLTTSSTTSSSPFSPGSLDSLHSQLSLHHSQPSLVCDAPARYELRFEPAPQPQPRYQGVGGGGEAYSIAPTAARKALSLLPPLVAMDGAGRERDERRNRVGDPAEEGRSGEQGRPAEEEVKVEPPKKRGPGRPRKPENELKKKKKKTGRLWEFIRNLLHDPETCPSLVKWENAEEGLFRFMDAEKVARKWGDRKQNREMNYEKLSRAMRYYYKTHIFEAVIGRRLVYKFGKNAKKWQPENPNFPDLHRNLSTHCDPPPPPPLQPMQHHTDSTPTIHLHTDTAPQIHHLNDPAPSLHHHSDSPQLHHHSDPSPPVHHHHQAESQHLSQYQRESSPPQITIHQGCASPPPPPLSHHLHHPHTLQSLAIHHHQLQPHHTT